MAAKPRPAGRREAAKDRYGKAAASFAAIARRSAVELWGIAREMVRIPAALFMRVAEILGAWVLRGWLLLWPVLVAAWHLAGRGLKLAQRVVTPARAVVLVALLTAVALAGSQWADLRGITIGTNNYIGLEEIAPPPQVETQTVGKRSRVAGTAARDPRRSSSWSAAHGAARSSPGSSSRWEPRWSRSRSSSTGRRASTRAQLDIQYESVTATLLTGFWAQLVSGVVLILLAPLLIRTLRAAPATAKRRSGPKPRGFLNRRSADRRDPAEPQRPAVRAGRLERLLPWTCIAAAAILFASQLMILFEFTPPGAEPLSERTGIDQHGPAILITSGFAILCVIALWLMPQPSASGALDGIRAARRRRSPSRSQPWASSAFSSSSSIDLPNAGTVVGTLE